MSKQQVSRVVCACVLAVAAVARPAVAAPDSPGPFDSQRLARAKDYIADEQWSRAIDELRAAIADSREPDKDEALFWLAHSQNQADDSASAVESIARLEARYPRSRWIRPARSLRIEIAQRLHRQDVLWFTAVTPPPPATPATPLPPAPASPPQNATSRATAPAPRPPALPPPPPVWVPKAYVPDMELRIQALSSLLATDAPKVVPILQEIALESGNAAEARSAIFVLARSGRPEARETVVQVAKSGPELVRIAAVRELARFTGPGISQDLLQVYTSSTPVVKRQVVRSLGERSDVTALQRIAQSEVDAHLREMAIITLGTAGGREQLRTLYIKAPAMAKRPIIVGLFNARGEDELIRIAENERDENLRREALLRLRLLGTPKARAFLEKVGEK